VSGEVRRLIVTIGEREPGIWTGVAVRNLFTMALGLVWTPPDGSEPGESQVQGPFNKHPPLSILKVTLWTFCVQPCVTAPSRTTAKANHRLNEPIVTKPNAA